MEALLQMIANGPVGLEAQITLPTWDALDCYGVHQVKSYFFRIEDCLVARMPEIICFSHFVVFPICRQCISIEPKS